MGSYASDMETKRGAAAGPQVVCVWCGGVIRVAAPKAAKRMCQPCFERMMCEHSRAHRQDDGRRYASDR
jgi:hypothetical protein